MDLVDRLSPPVDETTVSICENGSVSKRRRRKSLGRRVSFAEAPKLHIFPRDDEYETPTRATTDAAAGSPRSGGKRRSPRLAAKVVDADKENRVLNSNPGSDRGSRRGASKALSARGEGSPALKPQNWLDERDHSSQAGNEEENTGPVDLRHISYHNNNESDLDDENLTLDSTTFALKFSLHRSENGELAVVALDQSSLTISALEAFPDTANVLEKDMSFTMNRQLLRKRSVSESHDGVGDMTRDMSLTIQAPKGQRNPYLLASENTSPDEDSMISSDLRIQPTGESTLPGSKDGNSALVISSNNAENSPVPVQQAVDVRAQIEERFGAGFVGDAIHVTTGSDVRAELEAMFGTGFVGDEMNVTTGNERSPDANGSVDMSVSPLSLSSMDYEDRTITMGMPSLRHLIRREEDEEMRMSSLNHEDRTITMGMPSLRHLIRREEDEEMRMSSLNHEDRTITMGIPSLRHLIRNEEDEELRMASVAFDATHRAKGTLKPTEDVEIMLTEAEFTGSHVPPKDVGVKSTHMELKGTRETFDPTEEAEMMLTEAEITGADSPPKDVDVCSTGMRFSELQRAREMKRAREMLNPAEEAEMMLTEAEFTGTGGPPNNVYVRSTDMGFTELQKAREMQRAREMLNPAEEAKLMLTEAEFTGTGSPPNNLDVRSTDMGSAELQKAREMQRAREMLNPAEEAKLMLTEAEFTGTDSPPNNVDVRSTDMDSTELQKEREMQRAREMLNPAEEAKLMLTEAEFTGTDSPLNNADVRSTDMGSTELQKAREMQRAREMLDPAEAAKLMLTEAEFTGTDSPPNNVDVTSTDMGSTELQKAREMQRAREILDPAEAAKLMLTEAEFTGTDSPPNNVDVRSTDMDSTELQKAREMQRAREMLNPAGEAKLMLTEAEFTGTDSPPNNVDVRSTDMGSTELQKAREMQRAREMLNPAEEAKLMLAEAEFTVRDSPPEDVGARSTAMGLRELQRAREAQSPPPDTKVGIVKYTVREPHHPQAELDSTQEMRGPPDQGEMGSTEIEITMRRETNKLQTDGDVTGKEVVSRERETQKGNDTHSSPEIADTTTRDVVSRRRMPGGEELPCSADSADDAEVRDVVSRRSMPGGDELHRSADSADDPEVGIKNASKETLGPLQDLDLGAVAADITALQRVQVSQGPPPVTPGKRMPVVAFEEPEKAGKWDSPATTSSSESLGPNFYNRAMKRIKFVRNVSSEDGNSVSPTLEAVTAQVPRLSDLLAADMNSADSTPARPINRSMWMTPPSSVTAARAYDDLHVVMASNREREDDNDASLTSPIDSSMEIVEPTADPIRHSLQKSRTQATEESPKTSNGQVPESFVARKAEDVLMLTTEKEEGEEPDTLTRETVHPVDIPKTSQEKEMTGFLSSPDQGVPLQFFKTKGKDSKQEEPALREMTAPSHILASSRASDSELDALDAKETMNPLHIILRTSREEANRQGSITSTRGKVTAPEIKTHENDFSQDTSGTLESTAKRIHIFSAPHQKEVEPHSLPTRMQSFALEVMENQQKSVVAKEVVDPTQILNIAQSKENEKGILLNKNQRVNSPEKGPGHDTNPFTKEAVDRTQTISTFPEEEQYTPSSPRPTGSSIQLIRPTDLDKVYETNDFLQPEGGSKLSDDKPAHIHEDRIQEGGSNMNVPRISVEEFLQHTEVQFSHALPHGLQSAREFLKDPSLAETHHVRSLSECFTFLCLVKPQLHIMQDACEDLYEEVLFFTAAVAKVEERLTSSNPAIFSYFQNAPEWKKQRIRKQLERIQRTYRLLAEKNRFQFQQRVETEYNNSLLESKNTMMYYVRNVREERNAFDEKCQRPFLRLQGNLSSRGANQECTSTPTPKLSNVEMHLLTTVSLERIEDLKERLKDLETSLEFKLAKLRPRKQAAEDTLRGLKLCAELRKKTLSDSRSQVVDKVCLGKDNIQREEVARSPYVYVQKMRDENILLHRLQDGFQLKPAGTENQDQVMELSYRSLLMRRYVVRKVGTAVKVLTSSWALVPDKIEAMFPRVNALLVFSLALITTGSGVISQATATNSTASTQISGRLSALEAIRFTLSSVKSGGIPEPTSLRASMQVTRIVVGNLMELMEEVGKCQPVVNASCGSGVLADPRFRNAPDGQLQLELKIIDCVSSIKFFVNLDMGCLPLNGYPLGDLPAKVEIAYCAPKARHRFKRESLEDLLSRVEPGYQRLVRTYAAVGAFLKSIRRGVQ